MPDAKPAKPAKAAKSDARPKAPRGPVKGRGAAPITRRKEVIRRIEGELVSLRSDLDEILDQLRLRLQARLAQVQDRVTPPEGGPEAPPPLSLLAAEKVLTLISELKVRPRKGRLKDLGRVAALLDTLHKGLRGGR